ncbi:thiamine phosphate synthase [Kallotenue papyrolyticum]|uniref:thiamine phosphate synthase n=1 Tax=Kallotenue papyrolyticum TaxID=1325125 RepID=UPI00046E8BBB|nr:thiamine phosphate synthase [Kallotenue papyrolyticum]
MNLPDRLLLITDRRAARLPLLAVLQTALEAGCRWILVREKDLPAPARAALITDVLALAQPFGATVSVSYTQDQPQLWPGTGWHLPADVPVASVRARYPTHLIGASTHSRAEAEAAAHGGADYVTFSPVFPSLSKPGYGDKHGLERLQALAGSLSIPVVALGGITPDNAAACLAAGAQAVAVMGAVMGASNLDEVVHVVTQARHALAGRSARSGEEH